MEGLVIPGMTRNNMPEFPEVHTVIEVLKDQILGKKIVSYDVYREKNLKGDPNLLVGATILGFEQIGKFIVFHFDVDYVLVSHLRMEGKYFFRNKDSEIEKHDIFRLVFSDNSTLVYNDTRKFGVLEIIDKANYLSIPPLSNVGPDPFKIEDASLLQKAFKNKSIPIKTALLDQSVMSGLGNIYVDEVLFDCKIHPKTPAKCVKKEQLEQIVISSCRILARAIELGGSTIKSYHPKEGVSGEFQIELKVYGKKDGHCPNCGHHLRKIFVNGRGTTYCPHCQKNPASSYVVAVTGPVGSGKSTVSNIFKENGFKYLNADNIVHQLYKDKKVQNDISKFIPSLKVTNGEIDHAYLKQYLIDNPVMKAKLEQYVHPLVGEYIKKEIKKSKQNIVMEVPLLFESHLDELADDIVYVDVNPDIQIERLKKRDKNYLNSLKINSNFRIKNKEKATFVINNDGDVANLRKIINAFCGR